MAEGLGLNFMTMPIEAGLALFYDSFAEDAFTAPGEKKTYVQLTDSVKENVMARERARILAAAAAGLGAIFTCNGNKAELSVGYATFYGDLAGAFAAQADLWKYQVYAASHHFQGLFPCLLYTSRGHVDLGAQRHCSVVKFSSPHSGKQSKIFLNRPVPIRAGRWVGKIAAHTFEFIGRKFTDIG